MRVQTTRRRPRGQQPPVLGGDVTSHATCWPVYAAVGLVALTCYINGLGGDFVHDDIPAVTHNKDVLGVTPLVDVFRNDFWGTAMSDPASHKSYRPLTTLTFRVNYRVWGLSPLWFHVCNVLLHALAAVLFTRVCHVVAGLQMTFAGTAGLLFAAHPVHTEAVTGIVGRADVLACVFFLLSFLVYHGGSEGPGHLSVWLSVLLGGVAMLAKETGISVLAVNLGYDLYRSWPSIKRSLSEMKWNKDTLHFSQRASRVLMSLSVLLVFRLALLQGSLPRFSNQDNPAAFHPSRHVRMLTWCYLAALNGWLLLCPATLSHDWQMGSVPLVTSLADPRNIATGVFFVCCAAVAYKGLADFEHQRQGPLVLGGLLATLPFLPAANLVVTVGFVVAERVLYMPSLGFLLLVAYGAQLVWGALFRQKCAHALCVCAALLLVVTFCSRTGTRNRDWASREALIRAGLNALPHNAKMHYNFANFLRDTSQLELATQHYQEALRLWPTYASAHNNLGTLMSGPDEAEKHFLAAIRFSPDHVNAHYNLGQVYRKVNRTSEAVRLLERCIALDSTYTPAYLLLARLHADKARVGRLLRHVTRLQPNSPDHLVEYAAWLVAQHQPTHALAYYLKALLVTGTHRTSLLGAAKILRSLGQWPRIHQMITRSHIMSREQRGGVVYTGDLYIRSWTLETESLYRKFEIKTSSQEPNTKAGLKDQKAQSSEKPSPKYSKPSGVHSQNRHPTRVKTPRPWRRLSVNRSSAARLGTNSGCCYRSAAAKSGTDFHAGADCCSMSDQTGLPLVDDSGRSSGTAAFNQGYHEGYWSAAPVLLPSDAAVRLQVEPPSVAMPKERELLCLGSSPESYAEEEFSQDLMTG